MLFDCVPQRFGPQAEFVQQAKAKPNICSLGGTYRKIRIAHLLHETPDVVIVGLLWEEVRRLNLVEHRS